LAASEYMYGFFYAHPVHAGSCVVTHSFDWSRYLLSINCTSLERGEWRLAKCYGCHVLHIVCMLSRAWRGASQAHDQRTCFMKLSHRLYCAICMSLDNVGGTIATLSFLVWSEVFSKDCCHSYTLLIIRFCSRADLTATLSSGNTEQQLNLNTPTHPENNSPINFPIFASTYFTSSFPHDSFPVCDPAPSSQYQCFSSRSKIPAICLISSLLLSNLDHQPSLQ